MRPRVAPPRGAVDGLVLMYVHARKRSGMSGDYCLDACHDMTRKWNQFHAGWFRCG